MVEPRGTHLSRHAIGRIPILIENEDRKVIEFLVLFQRAHLRRFRINSMEQWMKNSSSWAMLEEFKVKLKYYPKWIPDSFNT